MSTCRVNTKSGAAALLLVLLGSGCRLQTSSAGTVEMGGRSPLAFRKLLQSSSNVPNSASPVANNQYTGYYNRGQSSLVDQVLSLCVGAAIIVAIGAFFLLCCRSSRRHRILRARPSQIVLLRISPLQGNGVWRQNSGLAPGLVTTFPTKEYKRDSTDESADSEKECAVCLSEYEDGDLLRQLPGCSHSFHSACIDTWLDKHGTCPICRVRQIPTPPTPEGNPNGSSRRMQVLETTAELPGEGTGEELTPREGSQSVHRAFFDALEHYRAELARVEAEAAGHLAAARPSEVMGVSAASPQVTESSSQGGRNVRANAGASAGDVMVEIPLEEVGGSRIEGQSSLVNPVGSTTREEKGPGGVEIEQAKQ